MKKAYLILIFLLSGFYSQAQFNPAGTLTYNSSYNFPSYSNCPQYNCFTLTWIKADTLTNDTLIGYNVYQNNVFYAFSSDTVYGCQYINVCDLSASNWFNNIPFWVTVKAIYDHDSIASISIDSIYISSFPIDVPVQNKKEHFTISPNPFSSRATLRANRILHNATLTLYDQVGQQISQLKGLNGRTILIERDNLPNGFFFAQLVGDGELTETLKLIVVGQTN